MKRETLQKWGIGLIGAVINSAASASTVLIVDFAAFDPFNGGFRKLGAVLTVGAITGAVLYLKQHPFPVED